MFANFKFSQKRCGPNEARCGNPDDVANGSANTAARDIASNQSSFADILNSEVMAAGHQTKDEAYSAHRYKCKVSQDNQPASILCANDPCRYDLCFVPPA